MAAKGLGLPFLPVVFDREPALAIESAWFVPLGDSAGLAVGALVLLLSLFGMRVLGQLLVAVAAPPWLPPMGHWYSGVLPYRFLLPAQVALVSLMSFVTVEVARSGPLSGPNHTTATAIVWFSYVYASGMLLRATHWTLTPAERRGVVIPIIFHFVLAGFCFVYGSWLARAPG